MKILRRRTAKPLPAAPVDYPSGTCVLTEAGVFYINSRVRLRVPTDRVFDSWNFPLVVESTEAAVKKYPITGKLGFRDGTLVKNIMDAKMYIIAKSKRRLITSPNVLANLNLQEKDAILVSEQEILLHQEGDNLN